MNLSRVEVVVTGHSVICAVVWNRTGGFACGEAGFKGLRVGSESQAMAMVTAMVIVMVKVSVTDLV